MRALWRILMSLSLFPAAMFPQLVVDSVAGGKIRSGVPAQDVVLSATGMTRDAEGNLVIASLHVIQRIRPDGIIETICGHRHLRLCGRWRAGCQSTAEESERAAVRLSRKSIRR